MGIVGEKLKIDFIISTGDNFYDDGLTGVDDAAFFESFVNIYTAPSLAKQWYNGNIQTPFRSIQLNAYKLCYYVHIFIGLIAKYVINRYLIN